MVMAIESLVVNFFFFCLGSLALHCSTLLKKIICQDATPLECPALKVSPTIMQILLTNSFVQVPPRMHPTICYIH